MTSFGDQQSTLVSNDTSFEEFRWMLAQQPRTTWDQMASEKLEEARKKWKTYEARAFFFPDPWFVNVGQTMSVGGHARSSLRFDPVCVGHGRVG